MRQLVYFTIPRVTAIAVFWVFLFVAFAQMSEKSYIPIEVGTIFLQDISSNLCAKERSTYVFTLPFFWGKHQDYEVFISANSQCFPGVKYFQKSTFQIKVLETDKCFSIINFTEKREKRETNMCYWIFFCSGNICPWFLL